MTATGPCSVGEVTINIWNTDFGGYIGASSKIWSLGHNVNETDNTISVIEFDFSFFLNGMECDCIMFGERLLSA